MSYRDFSQLNQLVAENATPEALNIIRQMLNAAEQETRAANTTASRYARSYATVETLVTDASQQPPVIDDVTSEARQSVPNSVIADTISSINAVLDVESSAESLINQLGETVSVKLPALPETSIYTRGFLPACSASNPNSTDTDIYLRTSVNPDGVLSFEMWNTNAAGETKPSGDFAGGALDIIHALYNNATSGQYKVFFDTSLGSVDGVPLHFSSYSSRTGLPWFCIWLVVDNKLYWMSGEFSNSINPVDLKKWKEWEVITTNHLTINQILSTMAGVVPSGAWSNLEYFYYKAYVSNTWTTTLYDWAGNIQPYRPTYQTSALSNLIGLGTAILAAVRTTNADAIKTELEDLL